MVTKSDDIWNAYLIDIHYAGGGNAGAALAENVIVQGTDTLVACDDQITVTYPTAQPEREAQYGLGAGLYANAMGTIKIPPGTGSINGWLQTDNWFDLAISGSFGSLMDTFTWHTDNGEEEVDHFGCWVEKLVIKFAAGAPTLQEVTIRSRSWSVAGSAVTKVAFASSAKSYMENVSATIDGLTSAALIINSGALTITNTVELEKSYGIGDNKIQHPALISRTVNLEIGHFNEAGNTWAADARNETVQLIDATLVLHSTLTVVMTNLLVESTNTDENEHGVKQHTASFKDGVGFTIA